MERLNNQLECKINAINSNQEELNNKYSISHENEKKHYNKNEQLEEQYKIMHNTLIE